MECGHRARDTVQEARTPQGVGGANKVLRKRNKVLRKRSRWTSLSPIDPVSTIA
jgi:hypothetical protein